MTRCRPASLLLASLFLMMACARESNRPDQSASKPSKPTATVAPGPAELALDSSETASKGRATPSEPIPPSAPPEEASAGAVTAARPMAGASKRPSAGSRRAAPAAADMHFQAPVSSRLSASVQRKGKGAVALGSGGYDPLAVAPPSNFNTENYAHTENNPFHRVSEQPLSTFSADVDTASYSNARRFLANSQLPPRDAIRVEEWLNYFAYDYQPPKDGRPFAVNAEVSSCPWNPAHKLVRIGLKGRPLAEERVPARNLVFLIDVSGSMEPADRLPLLKSGLSMLARQLRPEDSIAMVVYAGSSGLVLPPTTGAGNQRAALEALGRLEAGGSTNGGDGIRLAYAVAQQRFKADGINRVILATDGDFNVGTTSDGELVSLIEEKRKSGVFLTVLGFGQGNLQDAKMEQLANKGNGNYAYIDSLYEAKKVLVREAGSTLVAIAKDVKLQVEWNPARAARYRLVGYENRVMAARDFNDDKKDAGEIGAGHSVTALYEVVPPGVAQNGAPRVDPLKYQATGALSAAAASPELFTVKLRYKEPNSETSTKFQEVVLDSDTPFERASLDHRFAAAVANSALVLRDAPGMEQASLTRARGIAANALGADLSGDRREFLAMLDRAAALRARN